MGYCFARGDADALGANLFDLAEGAGFEIGIEPDRASTALLEEESRQQDKKGERSFHGVILDKFNE